MIEPYESIVLGGLTQVEHGIDLRNIDTNLIVDLRAGGASAHANVANRVTAVKLLTRQDIETRKVTVKSCKTVAMIDNHEASVTRPFVRFDHHAVGGYTHRVPILR